MTVLNLLGTWGNTWSKCSPARPGAIVVLAWLCSGQPVAAADPELAWTASAWELGYAGNGANALQTGHGLQAQLVQNGSANAAAIEQAGYGNSARIVQNGSGNRADIAQDASNSEATILQDGDGNSAGIVERGDGKLASISQTGNHNFYHIDLSGPEAAQIRVVQYGDYAPAVLISPGR